MSPGSGKYDRCCWFPRAHPNRSHSHLLRTSTRKKRQAKSGTEGEKTKRTRTSLKKGIRGKPKRQKRLNAVLTLTPVDGRGAGWVGGTPIHSHNLEKKTETTKIDPKSRPLNTIRPRTGAPRMGRWTGREGGREGGRKRLLSA